MKNATFAHSAGLPDSSSFTLTNLNLTVKKGEFVGIFGKVGSGKSSLLCAILGEMRLFGGSVRVNLPQGGIGYVQQEPWLQRGTVQDNILYGRLYQPRWYDKVVQACALNKDFRQLPLGDQTMVGDRGTMLSGGQKARIALARAVYQDKQMYVIDDIFSAIDAAVANRISRRCIRGLLRHRTIVLATHHPQYLANADSVVVVNEGKIAGMGAASELLSSVAAAANATANLENDDAEKEDGEARIFPVRTSATETTEQQESGAVRFNVYQTYVAAVGRFLTLLIFLSMLLMEGSNNATGLWLANWVNDLNTVNSHDSGSVFDQWTSFRRQEVVLNNRTDVDNYLVVYGSIAASNSLATLLRAFLFAYGGIRAASLMHTKLLRSVMASRMSFFDSTPMGRILNRFSSDLFTVDDSLPFIMNVFLANLFGVVCPVFVCVYAVPWIVLVLLPLLFVMHDLQAKYRPAARDLKRIGSASLSPIYSHFADTVHGLVTIRAMRSTSRFVADNEDKVEASQKARYSAAVAAEWLGLRLQLVACAIVTGIAVIAVVEHHHAVASVNAGLIGLAISYALGITSKLSGLVQSFTETEREMVAVERCKQYVDGLPREDLDEADVTSPYSWPTEGIVSFDRVNFRYRRYLPYALKNFTFETKAREKVGIVGRTGAGKSSLFQALFRLAELDVDGGEIRVDGVNAKRLSLKELRSALTIVPQDPFLFAGTMRENLDPLEKHDELQIWDVLNKCHLRDAVNKLPRGLDTVIEGDGDSCCLSTGQKQLVCLARAILSSATIVCVDEATANVDLETDRQVQDVLKNVLSNSTVITIAHRVKTVLGCDRVVVMANGEAVEVGHPGLLLQNPRSAFSQYVSENST